MCSQSLQNRVNVAVGRCLLPLQTMAIEFDRRIIGRCFRSRSHHDESLVWVDVCLVLLR